MYSFIVNTPRFLGFAGNFEYLVNFDIVTCKLTFQNLPVRRKEVFLHQCPWLKIWNNNHPRLCGDQEGQIKVSKMYLKLWNKISVLIFYYLQEVFTVYVQVYVLIYPHIEPPASLWHIPVSVHIFLLVCRIATLYAWPGFTGDPLDWPAWLNVALTLEIVSRGMMLPNGPMSG